MDQPRLIALDQIGTPETGYLSVAQYGEYLPFEVKRVFWQYQVPPTAERGNHAYYSTRQVLVAVAGAVVVSLEMPDGTGQQFHLEHPGQGLYVPALWWRRVQFGPGAVLLILSSQPYDPADNIRDIEVFRKLSS